MIEGVSASAANSVLVRPVVDQAEVRSYAANPTQVQQVAQAPYVSPYISMNYTYDKAVLQLREGDTGEVVRQIPTENQLRAYAKAASAPVERPRPQQSQQAEAPKVEAAPAPKVEAKADSGESADAAASVLVSA